MEEQTQSAPTFCRNGCGFYGSSATEGMCSQCFRDYQRRKQEQQTAQSAAANTNANQGSNASESLAVSSSSPSRSNNSLEKGHDYSDACMHIGGSTVNATPLSDLPASLQASPVTVSVSDAVTSTSSLSDTPLNKTSKKNRCFMCRKKVGLTGFHCRCGEQFCALHRYADKHNCSFDYKTSGREELQRKHPKVVATKVQKL